jgi:hypothetical protein
MIRLAVLASVFSLSLAASVNAQTANVSIVVDLDPASVERTVIVESITADKNGRLYLPDRVSGNILRVDPKSPKPTAVAKIAPRQRDGKPVQGEGAGVAFSQQGDLFVANGVGASIAQVTP